MKRASALAVFCVLGLVATSSEATEWVYPSSSPASASASPREAADAYLQRDELRLASVSLTADEELAAPRFFGNDHRTLRYRQRHQGLEVIGGQAAVRVVDGEVRVAVLDLARDLYVSPKPNLSVEQAKAILANTLPIDTSLMQGELAIWPDAHGGRLVWKLDMLTNDGGRRALVDAHDGLIVQLRPLGHTALGRVYPISSVVTPNTQDLELTDMVVSTPQYLNGWSGGLTVTNYQSGSINDGSLVLEQSLEPNSGEDFLYDPPADPTDATDGFAQVMVYYHLTRMRDFYATTLGLDMTAPSWDLVAGVNLNDNGQPLDNAFFSPMGISGSFNAPNLIGIGQGTIDFADDSDVFNHEFTHYVNENAIGYNASQVHSDTYGLSPFSGSIDEGMSDYFACTVNDDPILGEASLGVLSAARDLTDTSKVCPNDMVGEVHADGEIVGAVSWTIRTELGAARADALVWDALTLMTFGANFGDFYRAMQQTADDMLAANTIDAAERDVIEDAMRAQGLHECDPVTPLRKDDPRTQFLFGLDILGQFLGVDCDAAKQFGAELSSLFQFEVTPEAGDELVRVSVDMMPAGGGDLDWQIMAAVNGHVEFQSGMFLPTVSSFDYSSESFTTESGELVIDASSDPPFDPNATYTFSIIHRNCPLAEATLTTSGELSTGTGGGGGAGGMAGVGGSAEGGAGGAGGNENVGQVVDDNCGCRVAGAPDQDEAPKRHGWALLGLALAAAARRRRS